MKKILLTLLTGWVALFPLAAQQPAPRSSSDLYQELQKLNFLGTALYIAAHPDDENTRLIAYLANETKARTAYLSLTRGDGGQNLIGTELRELLGVLRTQELLGARKVDGGEQFFTRANDFGYSKNPGETLNIWSKDSILSDVVMTIRKFRPDIIINRFDHRTPGTTHGHHTTSAMLSVEAFDLAPDTGKYPDQLKDLSPWKPSRIFFNTSWWFYGSEEKFQEADRGQFIKYDVGKYYPLSGISNNELASIASSQHLSQGFGRLSSRGSQMEYLELLKGETPAQNDPFSGIDTSWKRVKGGELIGEILEKIARNFNFKDPSVHLPELIRALKLIEKLEDAYWKDYKTNQITHLIEGCAGFLTEVVTATPTAVPGAMLHADLQAINRSGAKIKINKAVLYPSETTVEIRQNLEPNTQYNIPLTLEIPETETSSTPYWLNAQSTLGMYSAPEDLIGLPETPAAAYALLEVEMEGTTLWLKKELTHKYAEPDKGELYQPFEIIPRVTSSLTDKVYIFNGSKGKYIPITVKAHAPDIRGSLHLDLPKGWKSIPEKTDIRIPEKGSSKTYYFEVIPPAEKSTGSLTPVVTSGAHTYKQELITIDYPHIPRQLVLLDAQAKVVRLNIERAGQNIGYIMGAGDAIPESLEQIGYTVTPIAPGEITPANLEGFDAIVTGIRAYNVLEDELRNKQALLLDYVNNGGTLIVQYNTAGRRGINIPNLAPYKLDLSRTRITDENSPVTMLSPDHPVLNYPNQITPGDFEGWVQERGLYFPGEWGDEFTPILSMQDPGEQAVDGSLLVAPYGKGTYIYTGLSFFRELPAGVPGAYKLFANILSLGKEIQPNKTNLKN